MKLKNIYILANLKARGKNRALLEKAVEEINQLIPTQIVFTSSAIDATNTALQLSKNKNSVVAACGGDGTVNSVINGVLDRCPLGIIPSGTANVAAKELGIPSDFNNSVRNLITGAIKSVDLPSINNTRFLFVAGIGFDAHVAKEVNPLLKKLTGKPAYHICAITQAIRYRPAKITVTDIQGNKRYCESLIIANMRRYGGDLFFAPHALYDDGELDLTLLNNFKLANLAKLALFATGKKSFPENYATRLKGKSFHIQANRPIAFQIDGEVMPPAETFMVKADGLKTNIIVP